MESVGTGYERHCSNCICMIEDQQEYEDSGECAGNNFHYWGRCVPKEDAPGYVPAEEGGHWFFSFDIINGTDPDFTVTDAQNTVYYHWTTDHGDSVYTVDVEGMLTDPTHDGSISYSYYEYEQYVSGTTNIISFRLPATSKWGLIGLALLLLATAGILIVRRRVRSE